MKVVVASRDLLSLSTTRMVIRQGRVGDGARSAANLLTDDLSQSCWIHPATPTAQIRFRLERPRPVAVVGVMGALVQANVGSGFTNWQVTVTLRSGALSSLASTTLNIPAVSVPPLLRPPQPRRHSAYWLPPSAPSASYIDFDFISTGVAADAYVGRLFAASGDVYDGQGEEQWSVEIQAAGDQQPGVLGGVRPVAASRGRVLSAELVGLSQAQAYGSQVFGAEPTPGLLDLQCTVGSSRPVLLMVRGDSADATDVTDLTAFGRLSDPIEIRRGEESDSLYEAKLSVVEAAR
jgi:hypothetical protein